FLELQALDYKGSVGSVFAPLGDATITVTNTGSVEPASPQNLVISEIMYHPENSTPTEIEAGFADENAFEFIELLNVGTATIDVSAIRFSEGIDFDFAGSTITQLPAGERLLLVSNPEAFQFRYGEGLPIAGVYGGQLSNS